MIEVMKELEAEGSAWLDREGEASQIRRFERGADMRYAGQAYELRVKLDDNCRDAVSISEAFHLEHERIYGFRDTQTEVELGTVRLAVVGVTDNITQPEIAAGTGNPARKGERPIFRGRKWVAAGVYDRSALGAGDRITGPAIIEQDDTTTVLLPGWSARADALGNLHLERHAQ
jgi:N-methylhydantoinase A